MNKILKFLGWVTPRGKLDLGEIYIDVIMLSIFVIIIYVAIQLGDLT